MGKRSCQTLLAVAAGLVISQIALAQSNTVTVTVKREAQLREAPADAAAVLASLPVQTQLTRLATRRGPWIEVRTAEGRTGWVHLFDVGTMPVAQGGNFATGALRGLTGLFGGGHSLAPATRTATATIGIRGLGAEEITNAQPNPTAVMLMETLHMDAAQAQQFGTLAGLAVQAVQPLPVPPTPTSAAAPGAAGEATGGDSR